jgi:hypothetical protein
LDGFVKRSKFKARESRVVRRIRHTPQRQRDETQRRNWTSKEVIVPFGYMAKSGLATLFTKPSLMNAR